MLLLCYTYILGYSQGSFKKIKFTAAKFYFSLILQSREKQDNWQAPLLPKTIQRPRFLAPVAPPSPTLLSSPAPLGLDQCYIPISTYIKGQAVVGDCWTSGCSFKEIAKKLHTSLSLTLSHMVTT